MIAEMPTWVKISVGYVLFRNHSWFSGPFNAKLLIVVSYPSFIFRRIEFIDKIKRLCVIHECHESVGKALGYVHQLSVFSGKFASKAFPKGR